jgi:hypothetical protein
MLHEQATRASNSTASSSNEVCTAAAGYGLRGHATNGNIVLRLQIAEGKELCHRDMREAAGNSDLLLLLGDAADATATPWSLRVS